MIRQSETARQFQSRYLVDRGGLLRPGGRRELLREMARLEGVVRTKTAEGKTQAYVLGVIPFVLIGAIHMVDEHWLDPLGSSTLGFAIISVAAVLWITAILLARKILAVDI